MCWRHDLHMYGPQRRNAAISYEAKKKFPLFSAKGHVVLNCFHVASVSVDPRSEVATDNNANETHGC